MADYATWKVTDLKAELKRRGIPQTGLRVKQNFIDRLVEEDAKESGGDKAKEPAQVTETSNGEEDANDAPEGPGESQGLKPGEEEVQAQGQDGVSKAQDGVDGQKQEDPEPEREVKDQAEPRKEETDTDSRAQPVEPAKEPQPAAEAVPAPTSGPGDVAQRPTPAEPIAPTDKIVSSVPSTEFSTPLPPEEALEDSRKRKRRSKSPAPEADAITNKKTKAQEESPRVLLPEDPGAAQANREKDRDDDAVGASPARHETAEHRPRRPSVSEEARGRKGAPLKQDARFRDLFAPAEQRPARPASPPRDVEMEDTQVEPASHPATAALYVDGLMRPLQPMALKNHLVSIATAPGSSPNSEIIQDFYLDSIKTHCFVSFANVSAASRARAALHGTVWPNERNRKALFVDFVPERKVTEWIQTEDVSRDRRPPPRWQVKYEQTDGGVEASLEEVDPRAASFQQARGQEIIAPRGPRGSIANSDRRPSEKPPTEPERRPGQGFKPLDDLFMSTTAKPKLYYLPVSREVADRRLDQFDDLIHKGAFPRPGGDETRRITFEDGDVFVDKGPEYGARRGRGPPPGRGRGRGRGLGDSWRGRYWAFRCFWV